MADFWTEQFRFYLGEHRHPWNRATHYVGIPLIVVTPVLALVWMDWRWLVGGQVVGWAFQLLGHRIEGNRPALLERPISLLLGPMMVIVSLLELLGVQFAFTKRARQQA